MTVFFYRMAGDQGYPIVVQLRSLCAATFVGKGATRMERTAARRINWIGDLPEHRRSFPAGHIYIRNGIEQ